MRVWADPYDGGSRGRRGLPYEVTVRRLYCIKGRLFGDANRELQLENLDSIEHDRCEGMIELDALISGHGDNHAEVFGCVLV